MSLTWPNGQFFCQPQGSPKFSSHCDIAFSICSCSCWKRVCNGIVCRHIICTMRRSNLLSCPISLFNLRWCRDFIECNRANVLLSVIFGNQTSCTSTVNNSEDARFSELSALCKTIVLKLDPCEPLFNSLKEALEFVLLQLKTTISLCPGLPENVSGEQIVVRNPIKAKAKVRPKTGSTHYVSQA